MSDLAEPFARLLGRQPSEQERQNLYRVRDALGLQDNDALWLVLIALEYYRAYYEKYPRLIEEAARQLLVTVKQTADVTVAATAERTQQALADAVVKAANRIALRAARQPWWPWLLAGLGLAALAITMAGGLGYAAGRYTGYTQGWQDAYTRAQAEITAAQAVRPDAWKAK